MQVDLDPSQPENTVGALVMKLRRAAPARRSRTSIPKAFSRGEKGVVRWLN